MKINDFGTHDENPFSGTVKGELRLNWRSSDPTKIKKMVDHDSGETLFISDLSNVYLHIKDTSEFTKLYIHSYDKFQLLSLPGMRMLGYVLSLLKRDMEWFKVDIEHAMQYCGYSSRTIIYSGLCSLLSAGFIARRAGASGEYFINVNFFFNGQRTKLPVAEDLKQRAIADAKKGKIKIEDEKG